jgi:signal transduction histidine kinase
VDVVDNGPGFDANHVANDGMSHTGLKNVRERLRHVCGGELIVVSTAGKGTTVKMIIPKE